MLATIMPGCSTHRLCATAIVATALVVTGCTKKSPLVSPLPAVQAGIPQPPASGRGDAENIWRLRAALNVAALSCASRSAGIVQNYNRLLRVQKTLLADAYRARTAAFRQSNGDNWQTAFDSDTTRLYNHYASPPAQPRFCAVTDGIAGEALNVPAVTFPAFATTAVNRIEQALIALAAIPRIATVPPHVPKADTVANGSDWRIQLGAYTGASAAMAAWDRIKARQPSLAQYVPYYQNVPARPGLVRLQIGNPGDRASALTLCALAAAGGFDCLPVRLR